MHPMSEAKEDEADTARTMRDLAEAEKLLAERDKLRFEARKLEIEALKLHTDRILAPIIALGGLAIGGLGFVVALRKH